MIKRGKRGQFYLVAAIIIAMAIIGITSIVNYSNQSSSLNLDEFKQDLQIESSYILDFASYNELSDGETNEILENFTESYIEEKGQGKNMYFIFGDKTDFTLTAYQSEGESLSLETDTTETIPINEREIFTDYYSTTDDNVTLVFGGNEKIFEIAEGENFYFIISNDLNGEKHVISN